MTTTTTTTTTRSSKKIRNGFVSRKISDLLIFMTMTTTTTTTTTFMHATEAFQQLNKYNKQIIILPSCSKFIGTGCCHNIPRRRTRTSTGRKCKSSLMTMRDRSASYWFTKGDKVKVIEDVFMNSNQQKTNLRNKEGIVVETWEKCNVDPTCCCAEQVDTNYAVRVLFNNNTNDANNATTTAQNKNDDDDDDEKSTALASASTSTSSLFYYYFAEDELIKAL